MTTCPECDHPECDDCSRRMVSKGHALPDGHVMVGGRGLCSPCYQAWRFRQRKINSPEWVGPRPARRRQPVGIGSWPDKHRDVKRAHSP